MSQMNLTRLQAVNRILRAAREHPVASLGDETQDDSLMAEQILDEILLREQMTGLHVNTVETAINRDSNDKIVLPSNTLQVKGWNQHVNRNFFHKEVNGVVYLFDADEMPATSDFSSDGADLSKVYVKLSQCLDFAELPAHVQFSIVDQAALEYQDAVLGDSQLRQQLEGRAGRSRALQRAADMRSRPHNQFEDGASEGPRRGRYTPRSWYGRGVRSNPN